jgi:uncharacterized protein (DUF2147 family)
MLSRIIASGLLCALAAAPAAAGGSDGFEGHWQNPKHTTVVNVSRCGPGPEYCAVVLKASAKAQRNAAKGGTRHFIGTEILRVRPAGEGTFKGTAFDPESNMHVSATVTMVAPGEMQIKGCALLGLVCQEQRWTKVGRN